MNLAERVYDRTIGRRVFGRRTEILCEHLEPLLPAGASVLDVGCGNGLVASLLQQRRPDITVSGVDVLVQATTFIPVQPFDGLRLPFADGSFDVVMFVDVLHHADDAMALLREARRVARQAILIKDHPCNGFLADPTLRFMDWVANRRYGIALPYSYWTREQWHDAFAELGLKIEMWETRLGLYRPLGWLFGRQLHFISKLAVPAARGAGEAAPRPGEAVSC